MRWRRDALCPQKLASGGRLVGIVRSRTKATELSYEVYKACNKGGPR
jgi:hypothetical protein